MSATYNTTATMEELKRIEWSNDDTQFGRQLYHAGHGINWCSNDKQRDGWYYARAAHLASLDARCMASMAGC